eukprot:TRINITY_DN1622_c0_g1_i1.p1 TRINITY_DN1622_c0_g1~~TRINITY_DN1622_c0_g1_i1.p1  ORF type:complete len:521 (-),score=79.60 TRINITY_DN1622_c0_g1_i1:16-1578(-)
MAITVLLLALVAHGALSEPLLLTPLIRAGRLQDARNLSVINSEAGYLGHSGFFTVNSSQPAKQSNNMFFWFQPCTSNCDPQKAPFILWFQGGPGGPSTFGAMSEIGNWWVDSNNRVHERCFTWCKTSNCLFIDQPVMTGFSYPTNSSGKFDKDNIVYTATSAEAMEQVYHVLVQFFQVFPEYLPAPLYITGESYAGLYCAHMGNAIYQHNTKPNPGDPKINLVGVAVGDPVLNAAYQFPTYPSTLYGMGVIMEDEKQQLEQIFAQSVANLGHCPTAFQYWNSVWNDNGGGGAPGKFFELTGSSMTENVVLAKEPAAFDYGMDYLVKPASHQAVFHFDGCPIANFDEGGQVYSTMVNSGDFCSNSSEIYAKLFFEAEIDVMIYSSTLDPLLGPPTTEAGVKAMFDYAVGKFPNADGVRNQFYGSRKAIWKVDSSEDPNVAGYARCVTRNQSGNRFCYTVIRNAGHESPAFQPRSNWDMLKRFIDRRPFDSTGDKPAVVPTCPPCGGVEPFAGSAVPACANP